MTVVLILIGVVFIYFGGHLTEDNFSTASEKIGGVFLYLMGSAFLVIAFWINIVDLVHNIYNLF